MADFPAELSTGMVHGRFIVAVIDSEDEGQDPDVVPAQGKVAFKASVGYIPVPVATGGPVTVMKGPIMGVLDADGYLCTPHPTTGEPMYRGVRLIATDDPDMAVTDWTWSADYRLEAVNGNSMQIPAHSFALPSGAELDLTTLVKVPSSPGYGLPQAEAAALRAEAAAQSVVERAEAGEFDGAPGRDGSNVVPTAQAVSSEVTTPGTTTYDALAARFASKGEPVRFDQKSTNQAVDALKVVNASSQSYALKVDQTGAGHDAVNIASLTPGGHTALGILASNTSFSTVKVTNNAKQVGGTVIAALGTDPERTASLFNGENSGKGGTYLSTMRPTGTGSAFQAVYDPDTTYDSRALWIKANHEGGDIVYVENSAAQATGSVIGVVIKNPENTAPALKVTNAGTGPHIAAENFRVEKDGNIKAKAAINLTSFNNARIQLADSGVVIDRNSDNGPALRVNNINAGSTGDIAQFQQASVVKSRITKDGHVMVSPNGAGPAVLVDMKPTGTGSAFQAVYDPDTKYSSRAAWVKANHDAGDIVYVENSEAQTSGSMVGLVQSNPNSTAPALKITNAGTGDHINAENFKVSSGGSMKAKDAINLTSFNNARIQLPNTGVVVDRNVGDHGSTLRVNNIHAAATGDIAQFQKQSAIKTRITNEGHLALRTNTPPADDTIAAGEIVFWFDSTNGAAQLMVKAKQANGDVKTGSIPLA